MPFAELLGRFGLFLAQEFQLFHLPPELDVGRLQGRVAGHVKLGTSLQSLDGQKNQIKSNSIDYCWLLCSQSFFPLIAQYFCPATWHIPPPKYRKSQRHSSQKHHHPARKKKRDPYWLLHPFFYRYIARLSFSLFICFPFFFNLLRHCHVYNFLEINCHQKMVIIYVFLVCWFLLAAHYSILCFSCWTQHTAGPNKNQDRSTHTHTIFSGVVTQGTGRLGKKLFLARPLAHIWHWTHWALEW